MHRLRLLGLTLITALALTALAAVPALASGKPVAETKPATSIGETAATLNGIVNPNGATTKYYFEFGTTTSYGKSTVEAGAGSGTTNLEESKLTSALTPNTLYHFRIVAKNANGTTDGADETFSTTGLPEFVHGTGESYPIKVEGGVKSVEAGEVRIETPYFNGLRCEADNTKGEITGPKTIPLTDELTGCHAGGETLNKCNTTGAAQGVVDVTGTAAPVYTSKSMHTVALDLKLNKTVISCTGGEMEVIGSVLSTITPKNTKASIYELTYKEKGELQELTQYEGPAGEKIAAFPRLGVNGGGLIEGAFLMPGTLKLTSSKPFTLDA